MMARRMLAAWLLGLGLLAMITRAGAQDHLPPRPMQLPTPMVSAHGPFPMRMPPPGHEKTVETHAAHAEHDENAPPEPINWFHGLLGEKADVPPSLLWRAPGEPPPFLASVINFGILVLVVVRFGKKPLAAALSKRKETILHELDEAKRLREAAEKRLAEYEAKLAKISEELERIRRDFREQGERDKERIVREAKERRERMKKDADFLLAQEYKQMQKDLLTQTVEEATRIAADLLAKRLTASDHDRFAEGFLSDLGTGADRRGGPAAGYEAVAKGGTS
jgi:F-type H+-transporting ATPase subunit b